MVCRCGNSSFFARQVIRTDIIVDDDNNFLQNTFCENEVSIYDSEAPYGPYTCTKCGKEYEELK